MVRLRRRLATLLAVLAVAAAASVGFATAAAAEYIRDFTVAVTVNPDTSFRVVETITYDFEGEYRHGIFRDIPVADETWSGQRRQYGVSVANVTMDGAPVPWVTSENGPYLNVKIGDPNVTITGPHTYVVEYTVTDGLRVISPDDAADPLMPDTVATGDVELYWDFVGTGWDVWIQSARASVTGPADVLSAVCYFGPGGTDDRCPAATTRTTAILGGVSLEPGDALTGAVVYPAAAFTSTPTVNSSQGLPTSPAIGFLGALVPAGLLAAVPIVVAVSRRRADAGSPVPGAPPQFAPPDDLAPAELSAAWEGRKGTVDSRIVVATLLDLAARRWIDLSTDGSGHLVVDWVGAGTSPMRYWETSLVGVILKGAPRAALSGYDKELATLWQASFAGLVAQQEADGRRNPDGDAPDRRWNPLGFIGFAALVGAVVMVFVDQPFLSAALFTVAAGTLIGFFSARIITPRRQTPESARFLAEVEGLRRVLGTDAAASRREFAQRSGLSPAAVFATMLPFAVVFRLENAWIGAFPDLTPDMLRTSGFAVGSIGAMDGLVSSGQSSMSSAMTAPSSGSGGGGSSGGGGGGGGGGSW